jgi:3-deoxy-D-manno-octulosonic acid kinase
MSGNEVLGTSVTVEDPDQRGVYWRYPNSNTPAFNPIVFDEVQLADQNLISGLAVAGRGNTFFVNLEGQLLVLRHYRRGGLARRVSANRYIFTGLSRTRAMLEFDILQQMHDMQLPVPKPFACRVVQHGFTYEASIVIHRLQGNTLAHQLVSRAVSDKQWRNIGSTIALFHRQGIYHADLNAHNIILSDEGLVSLIDFDRARYRPVNTTPSSEKWCVSNLDRLWRSLEKGAKREQVNALVQDVAKGFELLKSGWESSMTS